MNSVLAFLLACAAPECPGGSVRGVAATVPRDGGTVRLSNWETRELLASIQVSGYRRFEFLAVPAGTYAIGTEYRGDDFHCASGHYRVEVCDGPVEVYPGEDEPEEDDGFCSGEDGD